MQRVPPNISGPNEQSPNQSWSTTKIWYYYLGLSEAQVDHIKTLLTQDNWQEAMSASAARIAELHDRLQASSARIAELQAENDHLRASSARLAELQAENDQLRAQLDSAKVDGGEPLAEIAELKAKLAEAFKTIEELHVKLGQPAANDTNSGVPGSKVMGGRKSKSKKPDDNGSSPKRKKGGQKGHKGSNRKPAPPEDVDESESFEPESTTCPKCGAEMARTPELDTIFQQIEFLQEQLTQIIEARGAAYTCPCCEATVKGRVPDELRNRSLLGPKLLASIIMLRFFCNASIRGISKFLSESIKLKISDGCLMNSIIRASNCLTKSYDEIENHIKNQPVVYIDETPFLENGRRCYTWVFVTAMAVFFAISNRSRDMIERVLGPDYIGIICSDYYGVYISYVKKSNGKTKHQTCLAHLKREFKRCAEHILDREISQYGEKMLKFLEALFKARDEFNANKTDENLARFRQAAEDFNREGALAPNKGLPKRIAARFASSDSYTTFVFHPEVDATNNRAERAIRKIVTQRSVTQGTRGEAGRLASEKFWSAKATCELQNRSFMDYFNQCHEAHLKGEPTPSIFAL